MCFSVVHVTYYFLLLSMSFSVIFIASNLICLFTFQDYMPLPPAEDDSENTDSDSTEPKLQFSYVECLMFAFHQLARRSPEFLTSEEHSDRLKDFRIR